MIGDKCVGICAELLVDDVGEMPDTSKTVYSVFMQMQMRRMRDLL